MPKSTGAQNLRGKNCGAVGRRGLCSQGGTTGAKMARAIGPRAFGPRPLKMGSVQWPLTILVLESCVTGKCADVLIGA